MLLNCILPQQALKSFVRLYRIVHFDFTHTTSGSLPKTKAYRPQIEHCLQFTPFDTETIQYANTHAITEKIAFSGQHTVMNMRQVGKNYLNVQIVFQPGILYDLLKFPLDEITNIYTNAENFFSKDIQFVNEQLFYAQNYGQMIEVVESYLIKVFTKIKFTHHPTDRIAQLMLTPDSQHPMEWYANQSNLCYRHFDRMFKSRTGITPKEYTSLVRLERAYLLKNRTPDKDWLSIALESGFYDYQHLSREYKRFTGYTPAAFFELELKAPERYFGDFEK